MPNATLALTKISPALLKAVGATDQVAAIYAPLLDQARLVPGDSFATITSRQGIAVLVSQLAHESAGFTAVSENLNYSAEALRTGNRAKYFTTTEAYKYGYIRSRSGLYSQKADQRMIANLYYGSRLGNWGTKTDDGWDFRGAGLIQLTGRANFTLFGQSLGLTAKEAADFARTPAGAVASALWFWRTNGLLTPASKGDVVRCTQLIQGADGGLDSRIALYKVALTTLS